MNTKIPIEQLLRWRLAQAEAAAPPAPRGARLLELARPWWETWPEQFRSVVERLGNIQISYGHAMAEPQQSRGNRKVPAVIVRTVEEVETSVSVLYLNVRDRRLHLRIQLEAALGQTEPIYDATFISDPGACVLFCASAARSVDNEYRIDAELPEEIAEGWKRLKVTDQMPFRLIFRSPECSG